jgi:hypothetical protein
MAGECIESGQNGENGHFGEYSNSPNWQIFGEYSNSTNSPASGHCLGKIQIQIQIKIPAEFRQCNLEELVRSISCGRCIDSLYIGLPENKTKHNRIRDNFNNITIIPPENM